MAAGLFLLLGCSERPSRWTVDVSFSEALTVGADEYRKANGLSPGEHVEVVLIYRLAASDGRYPNFETLRQKAPVLETRDSAVIGGLFQAAEKAEGWLDCIGNSKPVEYYIAAFDPALLRVGVFRSRLCATSRGMQATVVPAGNASVHASRQLAAFLDKID